MSPRPTEHAARQHRSDGATPNDTEPSALRAELVDSLQSIGLALEPAITEAIRAVPRHVFLPRSTLAEAYANTPVHVKHTSEGTSISCASQPDVVARMLSQLDVHRGARVLEIGAGTGYNAALLAHLTGPGGHVTTIDVDDDLVAAARANLAAAGLDDVDVALGDGALGHLTAAPYDCIIATVGVHAIPTAWRDQLAPGGRLVVPQRLVGSVCRSVAYEHHDGRWRSVNSAMNTFMPLRRGSANDPRQLVALSDDNTVLLQAPLHQLVHRHREPPTEHHIDHEALAGAVNGPCCRIWTGTTFEAEESPEWMELYVACALPGGLVRMQYPAEAAGGLLAEKPYMSSTAVVDADSATFTYLAWRRSEQTTEHGEPLGELGVIGHGPRRDALAARVSEAIRTWDRHYRGAEATFELQPLDAPRAHDEPGLRILATPGHRVLVRWHPDGEPGPPDDARRSSTRLGGHGGRCGRGPAGPLNAEQM